MQMRPQGTLSATRTQISAPLKAAPRRQPGHVVCATGSDEPVRVPLSAREMRERAMGGAGTGPSPSASTWSTVAPGAQAKAPVIRGKRRVVPTGDAGKDLALSLALVADDLKGQDIMVLNVEGVVSWTSFLVICTAINRPQMQAMMFRMEKEARDAFGLTLSQNPSGRSQWECMDFGQVVVHLLTPENRQFYDLETFYAEAEEIWPDQHIE